MFNRKFVTETKLVNTKKQSPTSVTVSQAPPAPSLIEKISKQDLMHATGAALVVYASVKTINTLSAIAIDIYTK